MHIIIGIITALAGLLWALNSLQQSGFSFSSLNPFLWNRRRKWRKLHAQNPLYTLENPMDAAAAILLGTAKLEGEISKEHKAEILRIFSQEFNLGDDKARELFASSSYLLQSENNFLKNVDKVLASSADKFSPEQSESVIELMTKIAGLESAISPEQKQLINSVSKLLISKQSHREKW
ncbi:TerB family tellurite resistance protein [Aliikangiella coralliicola]|uniref:Phenylacetic acid degradation protein n=1 Tax=Aliikangiella coralliicola TaxID=2592383 RepID=A0A545UCA2_9GAMM|nr:TerB family tellurite resistance protein [Aliikangiella coralliicola]TQV87087.1 phenylacetic acid degradation protein [Aliikangiella coralliicola]